MLQLITLILFILHNGNCYTLSGVNKENIIVYVRPDNVSNTTCPGQPCELLDYYAGQTNYSSDTSFVFIPGLHILSKTFKLSNVINLSMSTIIGRKEATRSTIQCSKQAGLLFENVKFLIIKNVSIISCGQKLSANFMNNLFIPFSIQAAVALKNVVSLTMNSTIIENSAGYGMIVNGLFGNSTLDNCKLIKNRGRDDEHGNYLGGNFLLKYENCTSEHTKTQIIVKIMKSSFSYGYSSLNSSNVSSSQIRATGISLFLSCNNTIIVLSNVTLRSNEAFSFASKGGNLYISLSNSTNYNTNNVLVENTIIDSGNATLGGGVYIRSNIIKNNHHKQYCENGNRISFINTTFNNNTGQVRGGAMYVLFFESNTETHCPNVTLTIDNCNFTRNILNTSRADSGVAINVFTHLVNNVQLYTLPYYLVNISKTIFVENKLFTSSPNSTSEGATVYISQQRRETFISDSSFINNSIRAIYAFRSTIVFGGTVTIRNNSALNGGGLVLCQSSYILFTTNTTVTFEQNKATISGGGIYAEDQCLQSELLCFYQVYNNNDSLTQTEEMSLLNSIKVIMINNTAGYAGSQIFGGSMDQCATMFNKNSTLVYKKIFDKSFWKWPESDYSYVSSYPKYACFCDENSLRWDCKRKTMNKTIYPGQPFNVSLVGVGQFDNPVPSTIKFFINSPYRHTIKAKCTNITIKVHSSHKAINKFPIAVDSNVGSLTENQLRWIYITYRKCPLGTVRNGSSCYWNVDSGLSYYNANDQTIREPGLMWIGYYNAFNDTDPRITSGFRIFRYCPQLYCNHSVTSIGVNDTFFDQDKQCLANRGGIMCGACKSPYSLAISSTQCINCNDYSNFLIVLIWLGIIMISIVALILMLGCNFTITDGTLSGFLFYINIFYPNKHVLLRGISKSALTISSDLLAWLNMEIGFSRCFFNGFDAFGQVILCFIAPIIVWIILGFLIIISSKSSRVTRLIGSNAVKVLATLILVSYNTIIQTEMTVFSCSKVFYPTQLPNKTVTKHHWLADGNVLCWQGKHLVLVVIGILFGVPTVLYTLTLLFIRPLQRYSHVRGLRWVAKLKPFFDAYTSPHVIKPRYRFWPGLLLIFRMLNAILASIQSSNKIFKVYEMELVTICLIVLYLFGYMGGVYRKKWLNILNSSYYANITLLTLSSIYILAAYKESDKRSYSYQRIITYISISISFATFLLIIFYHVYKRLRDTNLHARCLVKFQRTGYWNIVTGRRNRRIEYVRLPQDEPQPRQADNGLGERLFWRKEERELNDQSRYPET